MFTLTIWPSDEHIQKAECINGKQCEKTKTAKTFLLYFSVTNGQNQSQKTIHHKEEDVNGHNQQIIANPKTPPSIQPITGIDGWIGGHNWVYNKLAENW